MTAAQTVIHVPDARLILPFIGSVTTVLRTMAGWEITTDAPRLKDRNSLQFDYSGIISFSGNIVGTVIVSLHRDTAIQLVTAFAGMEIPADTSDFADAIGELANMIAGAAKKDLGADAFISVPTVIMGSGHVVSRPSEIPCYEVLCRSQAGVFAVDVCIKSV